MAYIAFFPSSLDFTNPHFFAGANAGGDFLWNSAGSTTFTSYLGGAGGFNGKGGDEGTGGGQSAPRYSGAGGGSNKNTIGLGGMGGAGGVILRW